jgi:hypothetical protein
LKTLRSSLRQLISSHLYFTFLDEFIISLLLFTTLSSKSRCPCQHILRVTTGVGFWDNPSVTELADGFLLKLEEIPQIQEPLQRLLRSIVSFLVGLRFLLSAGDPRTSN